MKVDLLLHNYILIGNYMDICLLKHYLQNTHWTYRRKFYWHGGLISWNCDNYILYYQ